MVKKNLWELQQKCKFTELKNLTDNVKLAIQKKHALKRQYLFIDFVLSVNVELQRERACEGRVQDPVLSATADTCSCFTDANIKLNGGIHSQL